MHRNLEDLFPKALRASVTEGELESLRRDAQTKYRAEAAFLAALQEDLSEDQLTRALEGFMGSLNWKWEWLRERGGLEASPEDFAAADRKVAGQLASALPSRAADTFRQVMSDPAAAADAVSPELMKEYGWLSHMVAKGGVPHAAQAMLQMVDWGRRRGPPPGISGHMNRDDWMEYHERQLWHLKQEPWGYLMFPE